MSQLQSKNDRRLWEEKFNSQYIYPVLKALDKRLNRAIYLITTDEKQGTTYSIAAGVLNIEYSTIIVVVR